MFTLVGSRLCSLWSSFPATGTIAGVKRWIFNVAAAISLLLCIAWLALWSAQLLPGRTWWLWAFPHGPDSSFPAVGPDRYGVAFYWVSPPHNPDRWAELMHWGGFHLQWFQASTQSGLKFMHILIVPSWFALPLFVTAPSVWAWQRIRAKWRPAAGCCPTCGYDLRATPDRCPECGMRGA